MIDENLKTLLELYKSEHVEWILRVKDHHNKPLDLPISRLEQLAFILCILSTDRLPELINNRIPVDVQSLSVTVDNAQLEIANDQGNPIPVQGQILTQIHTALTQLTQLTPDFDIKTTSGTIAAGAKTISIANIGAANATVKSKTFPPNLSITWTAPNNYTLGAIAYDATGTQLAIAEAR